MRGRSTWLMAVVLIVTGIPGLVLAQEPEDLRGSIEAGGSAPGPSLLQEEAVPLTDIVKYDTVANTDYVAAGVGGLRGVGEGVITLAGVTGEVTSAVLYWQGPTNSDDKGANADILFEGEEIQGTSTGFSNDNCWGFANSQAYRADVTGLVAGDGDYDIGNLVKPGGIDINGASLLVFFDDGDPTNDRTVTIFNGNDSNISNPFDADGWNGTLDDLPFDGGAATLELHVSDGQTFPDDAVAINGVELVPGGAVFQGDTVPGLPGPTGNGSLWDIRSFDVSSFLSLGENDLLVTTGVASDCLSLVVAVVAVESNGLSIVPVVSEGLAGTGALFLIEYRDRETGLPLAGQKLEIEVIEGPNIGPVVQGCIAGSFIVECRTDGDGQALWLIISGADAAGTDRIRVFVDGGPTSLLQIENGQLDLGEPLAFAERTWYEPVDYVGMGDSYSSGEGAEDYFANTDQDDVNECHRSPNAYSFWVQTPGYPRPNVVYDFLLGSDFQFVACSGARSFNIYNQVRDGLPAPTSQWNEGDVQLDRLSVDAATTMAVYTIGGNDAGFGQILEQCATNACTSEDFMPFDGIPFDDWVEQRIASVAPRLDAVHEDVRADMPEATVFVLGYPNVFPDTPEEQSCFKLNAPFGGEQDFLRDAGAQLDEVVGAAAGRAGFHYVSTIDWFDDHEVCGNGGEWIRGTSIFFRSPEQFHPNAVGQFQYWKALENYIDEKLRTGTPQLPNGLPEAPGGPFAPAVAQSSAAVAAVVDLTELGPLSVDPVAARPEGACPGIVLPGEQVRLRGDGFTADAVLNVTIKEQDAVLHDLGTVTADASGTLDAVVIVPAGVAETLTLFQVLGADADGGDRALTVLRDVVSDPVVCEAPPAPTVDVLSPADGAVYDVGEEVVAAYSCELDGQPVSCLASVAVGDPIPTATPGTYEFTVVGTTADAATTAVTVTYEVAQPIVSTDPLAPYSVFGFDYVEIGRNAVIASGGVGVNSEATGEANLVLAIGAAAAESTLLQGDWISIAKDATAHDIAFNSLTNAGAVLGTSTTPLELPLVTLDPPDGGDPGTENVGVGAGEVATLEAGAYGEVTIGSEAVVTFTGGEYHLAGLSVDQSVRLEFAADAKVTVAGKIQIDQSVYIGPDSEASAAVTLSVLGVDGVDDLGDLIPAAQFDGGAAVVAVVEAFNGTINLDADGVVTGSLRAGRVVLGANVEVSLTSGGP